MDAYIGEIRMFAGDYAPQGWALCDGNLLNIVDNEPLFYLLGTTYGGNGVTNFALPDLRGRLPLGQGQGPGRSVRPLGQPFGSETVRLGQAELPQHTHTLQAGGDASTSSPLGAFPGVGMFNQYASAASTPAVMASSAVTRAGSDGVHDNVMASTCINFIISLAGSFPSQG